jgi:hypothetical protein
VTVRGDLALIVMARPPVPVRLRWQPSLRLKDRYHQETDDHIPGPRGRGVGDLATWMIRYAAAYERAVGVALEPGSLNVVIDRPWAMQQPTVRLEAEEVGVGLGLVRCQVGGLSAGLCVPTRTTKVGVIMVSMSWRLCPRYICVPLSG